MRALIGLELHQRLHARGWVPLLVIWLIALAGITGGAWLIAWATGKAEGEWLFSLLVYATLFLATVLVPALAGGSVSEDRASGVLALVQASPVRPAAIIWAKAVAAWLASLVLVLTAAPFLVFAAWYGHVHWLIITVSLVALLVELAFFAAVSVAFSGIVTRGATATALSYLLIGVLTVGTAIAYGAGSSMVTSTRSVQVNRYVAEQSTSADQGGQADASDQADQSGTRCRMVTEERTYQRTDLVWPVLAANPFVIVADATPARFGRGGSGTAEGYPTNLLTAIKVDLRAAQYSPIPTDTVDECTWSTTAQDTPEQRMAGTQPVWFWGMAGQAVLALLLLGWATHRVRTPYRRPSKERLD